MFTDTQKAEYVRLMEESDLTQKEIAKKLGLSFPTFKLYEARIDPPVKVVRRVVDARTGKPIPRPAAETDETPETANV